MKKAEGIALVTTIITLIGLPVALYAYNRVYIPSHYHGARVIHLTALATDGVWTEEPVHGLNYWRKHFSATPEIQVRLGEPIVLKLASADVLHSFSIPLLNIGPIDVPAGEVREVRFTPERADPLVFLCWQVCSPVHAKLRGTIVIVGPDGKPIPQNPSLDPGLDGSPAPEQEPDLGGN